MANCPCAVSSVSALKEGIRIAGRSPEPRFVRGFLDKGTLEPRSVQKTCDFMDKGTPEPRSVQNTRDFLDKGLSIEHISVIQSI